MSATPTRRAIVAASAAAAIGFIPACAMASDADTELLALRPEWKRTSDEFNAALKVLEKAEAAENEADIGVAREAEDVTCDANTAIVDEIAATPAHTLGGLRFKVEVSVGQDHRHEELVHSIMEDIVALADGVAERLGTRRS